MLDSRIEPDDPLTEADIAKLEKVLGHPVSQEYSDFACHYGGAFVGGLVDGDTELPILTFFDLEKLLSMLEIYTDLRDDGVLPVADCALGNLYVLDRENSVHYINYYGGRTTARKVAGSFVDFLARIVVTEG